MTPLFSAGLYLAGLLAGLGIVIQQVVNTRLGSALGSPFWGALTNFVVGVTLIAVIVLAVRPPVPDFETLARAPWYAWLGGVLGVAYVVGGILLIPQLGAASVAALFIVGQLLGAIVLDHFGLLGLEERIATWPRLAGAALLIGGVFLVSAY